MTTETVAEATCPKCGGRMWDNRETKTNPKAPDFKCRDKACDGVIWPPKGGKAAPAPAPRPAARTAQPTNIGGPMPFDQTETGAPPATPIRALALEYAKCLKEAQAIALTHQLADMGGDTAGAITAIAATIFIQLHKLPK